MISGLPFDDIRQLLRKLPAPDPVTAGAARARIRELEPVARLGPLGDLAVWFAEWRGRMPPVLARPQVAVFAGTHGVERHGVSGRATGWTAAMVEHCAAGGAAVNQACLANDVALKVFDLALDLPTDDITREAALDERGCAATMAFGMEAVAEGADLVVMSDLGAGNETVAAALLAALFGGGGTDWIGDDEGQGALVAEAARAVVDAALACHSGYLGDPLEALRRVGGREFAAIAGAILAARTQNVPVILDGLPATAAAAVLHAVEPGAIAHCRLAAIEPLIAHRRAAERLSLRPMLSDAPARSAGAAGALAAGMVRAATLCLSGMRPLPSPAG
ncbi:nicotinate-nucleotide--dimethylbenzimidazole phosphoribosyltransferase [Nitratireductor mangrovi]|uniref:Nicotinate-nucleotide--dimethylbenzimidazole phosphoribosyltransferase n=1 Tax=Nitratireductor mangrovi TaxID=2599600 RepID=A0A5B8KW54_9HYPH|nr:nicotinate-nucleotide--dimethylbenzimidazole phosphoribosyltransferase [Nitratireductor mangrovi]QDY99749.1 nicotinate-nucleotide--dimethylbenzimidazole phosphoribosyltransferase [Nitratireductor mangrovi]